jgi:hypothetical protein
MQGGKWLKNAFQTIIEYSVLLGECSVYYYTIVLGLQVKHLVNT